MITTSTSPNWNLIRSMASSCAGEYQHATISDAGTDTQATVEAINFGNGTGIAGVAIVVAFRGSSSVKDFIVDGEAWMSDLIWSVNDCIASVHHGFLSAFESVNVEVVKKVRDLLAQYPDAQIYITGHSLGGALAVLCALEFKRQKLPVAEVITFGQPRVGNQVFADIYDASEGLKSITWRVVNQNDIVPRTPGVLLGYRHCGQELFLPPAGGAPAINPSLIKKLFWDALGLYGAYRNKDDVLIKEHFIAAYQQRIQLIS